MELKILGFERSGYAKLSERSHFKLKSPFSSSLYFVVFGGIIELKHLIKMHQFTSIINLFLDCASWDTLFVISIELHSSVTNDLKNIIYLKAPNE